MNNVDYTPPATPAPRTTLLGPVTKVPSDNLSPYIISQVTPLQYLEKLDIESVLSKTPGCVVMSDNNKNVVTAMLGNGRLVGLPDPDQATTASDWVGNLVFGSSGAVDDGADSVAIDAVLDASDNVFGVTLGRNNLTNNARMYGFNVATNGGTTSVAQVAWGGSQGPLALGLQANMRPLQLYKTSILMTSSKDSKGLVSGSSVVVPLASLLSGKGAAFVSTSTSTCSVDPQCSGSNCCVTAVAIDQDTQGTITGNAYVDDNGVVALLAHSLAQKGVALGSFSNTGALNWPSSVQFTAETFQPNPVIDPWTNRVYWVGLGGNVANGDSPMAIYCVDGTSGDVCPGYGDTTGGQGGGNALDLSDIFDSSTTSADYFYTGAIVPKSDNSGVDRIVYTVLTADTRSGDNFLKYKPVGCVISITPTTGALLDSYCVKRDMNNAFSDTLYLASAPLVCLNARGLGKHTMAVAQFDGAIFAFDPLKLLLGPLYLADPLSGVNDQITISTDFLAMTQGGTLIFTGWDDQARDATVIGIPGFLAIPITPPFPPVPSASSQPSFEPSPSASPTPPPTSSTTPTPTPTQTPTSAVRPAPAANSSMDTNTKIGIGVGVGVGVGVILGLFFACLFAGVGVGSTPSKGVGFGSAYSALSLANIRAPSFSASGSSGTASAESTPLFGQREGGYGTS